MSQGQRRLAAIMFTDMVGFTSFAQRNEAMALEVLKEQEQIVRPIFSRHGGREIKSTGDGSLIEFSSALGAAECAIEILTLLHSRNAATDVQPILLRVGIHVGDVEMRDSDIFGDAVNVTARILTAADPEGIVLTEQVGHHLQNKLSFPLESLGTRSLKGVERPVPVFRVVLPWSGPAQVSQARTYPRVAVLPLRNISPDPEDAYFADGMTEELISVLGQFRDLRVISRSSVDRFKRQEGPIGDIGRELGATAVLEGSVRKSGDRMRISLQLIDAASQDGLWTQTYDRRLDDIFAVQAEVGERTAASLRVQLLGSERALLSKPPTTNLAAYGLYLQGIALLRTARKEDNPLVEGIFRRAIEEDPHFSAAHSQLASRLLGSLGETASAQEVVPEARKLIEKALELDPQSSEAHAARANLAMQAELNWAIADVEFRRAIELNPSNADARLWYSLLLRLLQRYSEAADQLRTVIELDPLTGGAYGLLASIMRLTGDLEGAEQFTRNTLRGFITPPEFHISLAYTLLYEGRIADAKEEAGRTGAPGNSSLDFGVIQARLGDSRDARRLLEDAESKVREGYVPLINMAILAASIGEADKAMAYLERDWAEGDRGLWYVYQGAGLDLIRSDARFIRLLERYNLPTSAPFFRWGRVAQDSHAEG